MVIDRISRRICNVIWNNNKKLNNAHIALSAFSKNEYLPWNFATAALGASQRLPSILMTAIVTALSYSH